MCGCPGRRPFFSESCVIDACVPSPEQEQKTRAEEQAKRDAAIAQAQAAQSKAQATIQRVTDEAAKLAAAEQERLRVQAELIRDDEAARRKASPTANGSNSKKNK